MNSCKQLHYNFITIYHNIEHTSHTLNLLVVARTPKNRIRTPKTGFGGSKTPKRRVKLKSEKNAFLGKNPHVSLEWNSGFLKKREKPGVYRGFSIFGTFWRFLTIFHVFYVFLQNQQLWVQESKNLIFFMNFTQHVQLYNNLYTHYINSIHKHPQTRSPKKIPNRSPKSEISLRLFSGIIFTHKTNLSGSQIPQRVISLHTQTQRPGFGSRVS